MIHIIEGNPGNGKTYLQSKLMLWILQRNRKWFKTGKTKMRRIVAHSHPISKGIEEEYYEYLKSWDGLEQLVGLREVDVFFDDMSLALDSREWANVPMTVKDWMRLHEHYGCDLYGNAQDFNAIDKSVRMLTTTLKRTFKIVGSKRPCKSKPPVKRIWGLFVTREVEGTEFEKEKQDRRMVGFPTFHRLEKKICEIFNTQEELSRGKYPPLDHIERVCLVDSCQHIKIIHR